MIPVLVLQGVACEEQTGISGDELLADTASDQGLDPGCDPDQGGEVVLDLDQGGEEDLDVGVDRDVDQGGDVALDEDVAEDPAHDVDHHPDQAVPFDLPADFRLSLYRDVGTDRSKDVLDGPDQGEDEGPERRCCAEPEDCPSGSRCYFESSPDGTLGRCMSFPAERECWDETDCRPGEECEGAFVCPCEKECPDPDLPGICTCPRPPTFPGCCYDDGDCPDGERCYLERCAEGGMGRCLVPSTQEQACWDNSDCGANRSCTGANICACGSDCILPDSPGTCIDCMSTCEGRDCGPNPACNGSCGVCPIGPCDEDGLCVADCEPECGDRECGPDPACGLSCGICEAGECMPDGVCCEPECGDRECGPDPVCGLSCGTCIEGGCDRSGECVPCDRLPVRWSKTITGPGYSLFNISAAVTNDCGVILAGVSTAEVTTDVWLLKLDLYGEPEWEAIVGDIYDDRAQAVAQTTSGLVVASRTRCYGVGWDDAWLVELDAGGTLLWQATFGGTETDFPVAIDEVPGGGLVVAAVTNSFGPVPMRPWIIKLDDSGTVLWQQYFHGAAQNATFSDVHATTDGGVVASGCWPPISSGQEDFWVVKLDADGDVVWSNLYDRGSYDCATSLALLPDGGMVVAGNTAHLEGPIGTDGWMLRLDAEGNVVWQKVFAGPGDALVFSVAADGAGVVMAGMFVYSDPRFQDAWAVRLDLDGNVLWHRVHGQGMATFDMFQRVLPLADGGLLLAGVTENDVWLLRAGSDGLVPGICNYYVLDSTGIAVEDSSIRPEALNPPVTETDVVPEALDAAVRPDHHAILSDMCFPPGM